MGSFACCGRVPLSHNKCLPAFRITGCSEQGCCGVGRWAAKTSRKAITTPFDRGQGFSGRYTVIRQADCACGLSPSSPAPRSDATAYSASWVVAQNLPQAARLTLGLHERQDVACAASAKHAQAISQILPGVDLIQLTMFAWPRPPLEQP